MSQITLTAFQLVPDFARGSVRDLRVRWALEEAGLAYEEHLIGQEEKTTSSYRDQQPFAQVPVYQEDDLTMFESGAIVLHIAGKSAALLPADSNSRARATVWMFAALNTLEPPISNLADIDFFSRKKEWAKLRRPQVVAMIEKRLGELAPQLEGREYLEESFTAADILMTTVLRDLRHTDILDAFPALSRYKQRNEARPSFQKALTDQLAAFDRHASPNQ